MKKLLFSICILFSVINAAFGQIPEPITSNNTGVIVGGAGVLKFAGVNPNAIASIRVINEKQFSSYAWDTTTNRMWQYSRKLAVGSRWKLVPVIEYSNGTPTTGSRDTAYKFVVDTIFRKAYICNQVGCVEIGASAAVTVTNGISLSGSNAVQLGGVLSQPTTIFTDATNTLKIRGLVSTVAGDSLVTVDPFTGQLRRRNGSGLMTNSAALGMFKTNIEYDFDTAITNAEMRNNINYVRNISDTRDDSIIAKLNNQFSIIGTNIKGGNTAMNSLTTGTNNIAIGDSALYANTSKSNTVAIGNKSLRNFVGQFNANASPSVAIGANALYSTTSGFGNTAIGANTMYSNTTGSTNTAIGANTMYSNTTGVSNAAIGLNVLRNNTTGSNNNAIGYNAMNSNTTGSKNTGFNTDALFSNTTGFSNSAIGYYALRNNTTGSSNTALGVSSLENNTIGYGNVAIGDSSAISLIEGNNNIIIGYKADISNSSNQLNIGNWIIGVDGKIAMPLIPVFANDAAADADSTLVSGSFYRITGSRVVYQKP